MREAESDALEDFLEGAPESEAWVTSALGVVECHRTLRSALAAEDVAEAADNALGDLAIVAISNEIIQRASAVGGPSLRTLDAIHLAAAEAAGATAMVTYDQRLAEAAREEGLTVFMPGPD